MACLLVPAGEALVTTLLTKVLESKGETRPACAALAKKLPWLNKMLWGGSALLAFEHVWHGEILPVFPFLTAVRDGETAAMLQEMATTGVAMALLVTAVWGVMAGISYFKERKNDERRAVLAEPAR